MTILVTGGAGFIGSHLVDLLIKEGRDTVVIDDLSGGYKENINFKAKFYQVDVRDKNRVNQIINENNITEIFHLAAYAAEGQSFFSPCEINDINLKPMNNLIISAVNNNVKRIIQTSSMAVFGDQTPPFQEDMPRKPVDPYGAAKTYCEQMLEIYNKEFGLEYCIIRPHNIYGSRQNIADPYRNVLGIWMNRIMRDKPPIIYGDGEQTRAFSYIEDIIKPLANAGFRERANKQIINLGSSEVVTVNEACKIVCDAMGYDKQPVYLDARPGEVKHAHCTIERSRNILGYETKHTFKQGVIKMAEWAKTKGATEPTYTLPLEITKNAPKPWVNRSM